MHSQKYNLAISGHDTKPVSFFDGAEIGSGLLEGVCTLCLWLKQAEVLSATLSCFSAGADCLCMCVWPYMFHFLLHISDAIFSYNIPEGIISCVVSQASIAQAFTENLTSFIEAN